MIDWEQFDLMVEEDVKERQEMITAGRKSQVLLAQINVLLAKKDILLSSSYLEIQQLLRSRFHVESTLEDIEAEMIVLNYYVEDDVLDYEEDYEW
jgi:hypothetical protein